MAQAPTSAGRARSCTRALIRWRAGLGRSSRPRPHTPRPRSCWPSSCARSTNSSTEVGDHRARGARATDGGRRPPG